MNRLFNFVIGFMDHEEKETIYEDLKFMIYLDSCSSTHHTEINPYYKVYLWGDGYVGENIIK